MSEIFRSIEATTRAQETKYYGKFRAIVVDNEDPQAMGRLILSIPSVLGQVDSTWALPIVPYGGADQVGMLSVPPVGASVVAEFLEGDASSPVWSGTFWRAEGEVPEAYENPDHKVLMTRAGHKLVFDDTDDAARITLTSGNEAEILLDENGSIQLTGQDGGTVTLDAEAGELTVEDANGNSISMTSSGMTCVDSNGNEIVCAGGGVDITTSSTVNITGSSVNLAGSGGAALVKDSFLNIFNAHQHPIPGPSGVTGPPTTPAPAPAHATMKTKAS
ncbi:phage baseplate assembly protein V [Shimia ponticola]|uniref:phage baseplate assembly protein V n=1 Tax=Shimia ponticola TaxID=2582893 RepID=UPI0011BDD0B3|nr:phage baseplate assembly protein V [Shimia ponticola]